MKFFQKKKRKAAISIFLTIILIPTLLLSAVLVDGSRVSSARAIVQEASDLAAVSALATYNMELKDQFGLFAIDDPDKLDDIYRESLDATLMAYGLDGQEYSEMIWSYMKNAVTGGQSYQDASFLNLYDFRVEPETTKAEALYPLIEKEVLKTQMVEHAKFRGIYVALDRMDILTKLGESRKQAQDNADASDVMEDKMAVDEDNADADKAVKELSDAVQALMETVKSIGIKNGSGGGTFGKYFSGVSAQMEILRYNNIYPQEDIEPSATTKKNAADYINSSKKLYESVKKLQEDAKNVLKLADPANKESVKAVERLDNFSRDNSGDENETVQNLCKDADENKKDYQNYVDMTEKILNDEALDYYAHKFDPEEFNIGNTMSVVYRIDEAITKDEERIQKEKAEFESRSSESEEDEENEEDEYVNDHYDYYYLNMSQKDSDRSKMIDSEYRPAALDKLKSGEITLDTLPGAEWANIKPTSASSGDDSKSKINKNFAQEQSKKKTDGEESEDEGSKGAERGEIERAVYDARPSKNYSSDTGKTAQNDFYNENGDLDASKKIIGQGKDNMLLQAAEVVRDDALCLTYMFGTFKTRLTGVEKFSSEKMSQSDKDSFYMPEWRHAHPEGELDMRFEPKKNRETVLRSEIEYLIYGLRTDAANEAAVYSTIYAERMANNMIALYMNSGVKTDCNLAAIAASAATTGIVPQTVFFWIFLTAWAAAETFVEMNYLISDGYKVPLIKTKDNILLSPDSLNADGDLINNYGEKGVFVSYEDYLLLLLLIKGDDKRMMRSADLIEMNMKKNGQSDFTMDKAYTYMKADTTVSLRYLFGSVMPFQADYAKQGYTGRLRFSSSIYMGY